MASAEQVERALRTLVEALGSASTEPGAIPDRTLLCVVPDLDVAYRAELRDAKVEDLVTAERDERADVRITASSDDLVALIEGRMSVASALLFGRVRVDASTGDLMLLRRLL